MNRTYLSLAMLAASAALTACGGGSSGTTAVVPPPVPPPPSAETVTVTGFVTDMPIPNATVILTVNGQQFMAADPTGVDGSFSVEISSDDPDAMVQCEAFDPNGPARFSALLDNFAGLQDSADTNGVATDVNITNVTTAQFLLAQDLAADGSIDSIEELQDIAGQIDADALLQLSAAIKVVVDSIAGVALPSDFDDVQELAQAIIDGTTTFLDDIETVNPGILADAIDEVVSDGFATVDFSADDIPGVYVTADGEDIVLFDADGTGLFGEIEYFDDGAGGTFDSMTVEAVTWSITADGELQIVFTETQDIDTVVMLNNASGVLTLYSSTQNGDGTSDDPDTFSVVSFDFDADGFDAAAVPGSYRDPDADDDEETEYTVFLADGSGYDIDVATGEQDDFFNWEVNAAGELIIVDDGLADSDGDDEGDERQVVRLLQGSTDDTRIIVAIEYELDGDTALGIEAFPVSYTPEILTGPMPDMANTVLLEGKTYAWSESNERALSTFGANGVFTEIIQDYDEIDGPEFGEDSAEWFIDADARLFLTFTESDGSVETDQADVVSGLGENRMVVALEEDDGNVTELGLDLVLAFDATEVVGNWALSEDGEILNETVTFGADGSGTYFDDGLIEDTFEWSVNSSGTLVVTLDDGPGAPAWTDNFHKLADSTGDVLHVFVVFRIDGQLVNDAENPEGPPQVIEEVTLVRQP